IPFGVLFGKLRGVDVQTQGSGNIGATNVARTVGKKIAIIVLLLDAGKGAAPLLALRWLGWPATDAAWAVIPLGLAPILGHCFSPWLRLRGGKGVATSLGVIAAADIRLAGIAAASFALVYAAFRVASIASLTSATVVAVLFWLIGPGTMSAWMMSGALAVVVIQHRGNIRRILGQSELKV
ncbi:MAG: glycerol-3-phosphate acyltransferase, partial [Deltaproteobacteria bacterium]|nr:glycerol-3-phosphate acyltransferase [Deltaproteobacteria bacterium]